MIDEEICIVEMCEKPTLIGEYCTQHRKKDIAGGLEFDADGTVWDTCSRGHRWTPANTHYEATPNGGRRRRCRLCLAEKARRKAEEPVVPEAPGPVMPKNELERKALLLQGQMNAREKAPCAGRQAEFTDYTASTMPTAEQAKALCDGCPFLQACANNAAAAAAGWGVWGSEVWYYGYRDSPANRKMLDADD